jgi:hypothetical protein
MCFTMVSKSGTMPLRGSLQVEHREAVARAGVDEGAVELLLVGVQVQQQFQHLVVHAVRIGVLAVDLVDDHDGLEAVVQRLLQHEAGLRLRAVHRVHQQQHAVHHLHDALHLAAEIGVAGGVHDVDRDAAPVQGGVLGLDGDALLALQVHGIHGALFHFLAGGEGAAFPQQFVDQRRLAVVDVGDDGDIAVLDGTHVGIPGAGCFKGAGV